jgi:hypothetical protein
MIILEKQQGRYSVKIENKDIPILPAGELIES